MAAALGFLRRVPVRRRVPLFRYVGAFLIHKFGLGPAGAGLTVAGFGVGAFVYTRFARRLVRRLGEGNLVLLGGVVCERRVGPQPRGCRS
jgi:hypothetical protein